MSIPDGLLEESAEDLFETAPCGYLTKAAPPKEIRALAAGQLLERAVDAKDRAVDRGREVATGRRLEEILRRLVE